jgi:hypothetical protein
MKSVANHMQDTRCHNNVEQSLIEVNRSGAGRAVDDREVGSRDGREGQCVQEMARLHLWVTSSMAQRDDGPPNARRGVPGRGTPSPVDVPPARS